MSDTPETREPIYCWAETQRDIDALRIVALNSQGTQVVNIEALDVNTGQIELKAVLGRLGISSETHRVEWVPTPDTHAGVQAALARARQDEAGQVPDGPERTTPMALRSTQAREHICSTCGHAGVCALAAIIRGPMAASHPTLSACGAYEPPVPEELQAIADQITGGGG